MARLGCGTKLGAGQNEQPRPQRVAFGQDVERREVQRQLEQRVFELVLSPSAVIVLSSPRWASSSVQ